jgi:hypothetical protein
MPWWFDSEQVNKLCRKARLFVWCQIGKTVQYMTKPVWITRTSVCVYYMVVTRWDSGMGRTRSQKDRIFGTHNIPSHHCLVTHSTQHRIWHTRVPALPKHVEVAPVFVQSCDEDYHGHDNSYDAGQPLENESESPVGLKVK